MQVRSILGQTRPDRQTLLFSATMPGKVERLVRDALASPVRVTVGEVGAANEDIRQARPCILQAVFGRWLMLVARLLFAHCRIPSSTCISCTYAADPNRNCHMSKWLQRWRLWQGWPGCGDHGGFCRSCV